MVQSKLCGHETTRSIPNYRASSPTQSHLSQSQSFPPPPLPFILNDTTSSISRGHSRSKNIVTAIGDRLINGRMTSLTPSDSTSNVYADFQYGNGTTPGTVAGYVAGSSGYPFHHEPPADQPQPPKPARTSQFPMILQFFLTWWFQTNYKSQHAKPHAINQVLSHFLPFLRHRPS